MKNIGKCKHEGCNEIVGGNHKYCLEHSTEDYKKIRNRILKVKWRRDHVDKVKEDNKKYKESTKGIFLYELIGEDGKVLYVGSTNNLGRVTSYLTGNTHIHIEWRQWISNTEFLEYVVYETKADKREGKKNVINYNDICKYKHIDESLKGWEVCQGYKLSCVKVADVSEFVTLDNKDLVELERLYMERLFILQDAPSINSNNPMGYLENKLGEDKKDFLKSIIDEVVWENKNILGTFKRQGCIDLREPNTLFNYKNTSDFR